MFLMLFVDSRGKLLFSVSRLKYIGCMWVRRTKSRAFCWTSGFPYGQRMMLNLDFVQTLVSARVEEGFQLDSCG